MLWRMLPTWLLIKQVYTPSSAALSDEMINSPTPLFFFFLVLIQMATPSPSSLSRPYLPSLLQVTLVVLEQLFL